MAKKSGKVRRAGQFVAAKTRRAASGGVTYIVNNTRSNFSASGAKKLIKRAIMVGLGGAVGGVTTVVGDVYNVEPWQYTAMGAGAELASLFLGADNMADAFAGAMGAHALVKTGTKAIKALLPGQ